MEYDRFTRGSELQGKTLILGDCTNIEHHVNRESFIWEDLRWEKDLLLQRNRIRKNARILTRQGIQIANGSLAVMEEKAERLTSGEFLRRGDVIGVSRGLYEHYAIYIGNHKVIHYAGGRGDFSGKVSVHEADFSEFLRGAGDYFVLSFAECCPCKIHSESGFWTNQTNLYGIAGTKMKPFAGDETVKRAYSRIGEQKYSLLSNNCEHFALWCKTGIAVSSQVRNFVEAVISSQTNLREVRESKHELYAYLAGK